MELCLLLLVLRKHQLFSHLDESIILTPRRSSSGLLLDQLHLHLFRNAAALQACWACFGDSRHEQLTLHLHPVLQSLVLEHSDGVYLRPAVGVGLLLEHVRRVG